MTKEEIVNESAQNPESQLHTLAARHLKKTGDDYAKQNIHGHTVHSSIIFDHSAHSNHVKDFHNQLHNAGWDIHHNTHEIDTDRHGIHHEYVATKKNAAFHIQHTFQEHGGHETRHHITFQKTSRDDGGNEENPTTPKTPQLVHTESIHEGDVVKFRFGSKLHVPLKPGETSKVLPFKKPETKTSKKDDEYVPRKHRINNYSEETNQMSESVKQIINTIIDGQPSNIKTTISSAIEEKVAEAIEGKKIEIANRLIGLGESDSTKHLTKFDMEKPDRDSEKAERAKKLALDKIKKQAKNEQVDLTDEEAELILEELLEAKKLNLMPKAQLHGYMKGPMGWGYFDNGISVDKSKFFELNPQYKNKHERVTNKPPSKITKETVEYVSKWFTEEEMEELLDEATGNRDQRINIGLAKESIVGYPLPKNHPWQLSKSLINRKGPPLKIDTKTNRKNKQEIRGAILKKHNQEG